MNQIKFLALALAATLMFAACGKSDEMSENKDNIYQFKVLDGQGDSV